MNTKRLLALAEFLENEVPKAHFNMAVTAEDGFNIGDVSSDSSESSAGCAFAWATELFPKQLKLREDINGKLVIGFGAKRDFEAAETFFGISSEDVDHLFIGDNYPSSKRRDPSYAAKRIYAFVETKNVDKSMQSEKPKKSSSKPVAKKRKK